MPDQAFFGVAGDTNIVLRWVGVASEDVDEAPSCSVHTVLKGRNRSIAEIEYFRSLANRELAVLAE
jgi:hypothetical protein